LNKNVNEKKNNKAGRKTNIQEYIPKILVANDELFPRTKKEL
jgi:hypothetical protein